MTECAACGNDVNCSRYQRRGLSVRAAVRHALLDIVELCCNGAPIARAVWFLDSFKTVLYPYPIPEQRHSHITLGEFIFSG